jgi:hypothetical protein
LHINKNNSTKRHNDICERKNFITFRTLQEILPTKHVISSEDRIELTESMYDVKQRNQRLFTYMWFKIKATEINIFVFS